MKEFLFMSFSGWISAFVFGTVFSLVYKRYTDFIQFKNAKLLLEIELRKNLEYMAFIYWQEFRAEEGQFERDLHYPVRIDRGYITYLFRCNADIKRTLMQVFSTIDFVIDNKIPATTMEDFHDFVGLVRSINSYFSLNLEEDFFEELFKRDFSIR